MKADFKMKRRPTVAAPKRNPHPGKFRCRACGELKTVEKMARGGGLLCKPCGGGK